MRIKDCKKEKAVVDATIKLINECGLNTASISKIAKEAGVSQGTIYIYYENKDDLVVSIYYDVKQRIIDFLHKDLDEKGSVEQNLRALWNNTIKVNKYFPELVSYDLQFSNSPFYDLVDQSKMHELAKPLVSLLERGVREKMIKEMSVGVFMAFFMSPANFLSSRKMFTKFIIDEESIEETFQLAFKTISYK